MKSQGDILKLNGPSNELGIRRRIYINEKDVSDEGVDIHRCIMLPL
jgi:hypothetical protein